MITLPYEAELDIINFMKKFEHMRDEDIKNVLRLMLAKYLQIVDSDFMLTRHNLHNIINDAKSNFTQLPSEVYLDGLENKHKLTQGNSRGDSELRTIAITQAVLGELRKEKVLGRPVKFNFKKR